MPLNRNTTSLEPWTEGEGGTCHIVLNVDRGVPVPLFQKQYVIHPLPSAGTVPGAVGTGGISSITSEVSTLLSRIMSAWTSTATPASTGCTSDLCRYPPGVSTNSSGGF